MAMHPATPQSENRDRIDAVPASLNSILEPVYAQASAIAQTVLFKTLEPLLLEQRRQRVRDAELLNRLEKMEKRLETLAAKQRKKNPGFSQTIVHQHYYPPGAAPEFPGVNMNEIGRNHNTMTIIGSRLTNVAVGNQQALQDCFNTIQRMPDSKLKKKLEELHHQMASLMEKLDERQRAKAKEDLETFVQEATKPEPRKKWFDLSKQGLIDAAQTVKELAGPISATLREIGKVIVS
jgi:chaperonin cofactor prefoldin